MAILVNKKSGEIYKCLEVSETISLKNINTGVDGEATKEQAKKNLRIDIDLNGICQGNEENILSLIERFDLVIQTNRV